MIFNIEFHLSWLFALAVFPSGFAQPADTLRAGTLLHDARSLFESAEYAASLEKVREAEGIYRQNRAAPSSIGWCKLLAGDIFFETGAYEQALSQYRWVLDTLQKLPGHQSLLAQAKNNVAEYLFSTGNYSEALSRHREVLEIRRKLFGESSPEVADSYNNLGNCYFAQGRYRQAEEHHVHAYRIRKKSLPPNHPDLAVSLSNLGNCYYAIGDFEKAEQQHRAALELRTRIFGESHPKTAASWNALGKCAAARSDARDAIRLFEKSLDLRRKKLGDRHPAIADSYESIGDVLADKGDTRQALRYYRQAIQLRSDALGAQHPGVALLLDKCGLCLQMQEDFQQAADMHRQAIERLATVLDASHPYLAEVHTNLGNCLFRQKMFSEALAQYDMSRSIILFAGSGRNTLLAASYNNSGLCLLESGQPGAAQVYFQKAVATSTHRRDSISYLNNSSRAYMLEGRWTDAEQNMERALALLEFKTGSIPLRYQMELLSVLTTRAELTTRKGAALEQRISAYEKALEVADFVQLNYVDPEMRSRVNEQLFRFFEEAIGTYVDAWKVTGKIGFFEKAFDISERGKSLLLVESVRRSNPAHIAGVPAKLLQEEVEWQRNLQRLNNRNPAQDSPEDFDRLIEWQAQREKFLQRIEKEYPAFYELKYSSLPVSLPKIQQELLAADQAMIEYFTGDSSIWVFVVTKSIFDVVEIRKDFPLDEWVLGIRRAINDYPKSSGEQLDQCNRHFSEYAFNLYDRLIGTILRRHTLPGRWMIVPDGALHYLPFEVLLRQRPANPDRYKNHAYLLRDYQLSYSYSATFWDALKKRKHRNSEKTLLAIAPDFNDNSFWLSNLRYNLSEAQHVASLYGGELLQKEQATKEAFLSRAGQFRLLLLATHGEANPRNGEYSWLAFTEVKDTLDNELLYANDLYGLSLEADLVVLSACETGVGEYRRGEGILSLAWGFFYAGARSLVPTLWSVDDARNSEIVKRFFDLLKSGKPAEEALHRAKLDFLESHPHDEAHPVYWAGAILIGETPPHSEPTNIWLWVVGGLMFLLLIWGWRNRAFWRKAK